MQNVELPLNPHLVLQCCASGSVPEACQEPCSIRSTGFPPPPLTATCEAYATTLVACANDGLDHRECCAVGRVPSRCQDMCNAKAELTDESCKRYVPTVLFCSMRSHEKMPNSVGPIHYEQLSSNSIRVPESHIHPFSSFPGPLGQSISIEFAILRLILPPDQSQQGHQLHHSRQFPFAILCFR